MHHSKSNHHQRTCQCECEGGANDTLFGLGVDIYKGLLTHLARCALPFNDFWLDHKVVDYVKAKGTLKSFSSVNVQLCQQICNGLLKMVLHNQCLTFDKNHFGYTDKNQ